MTIDLKTIKHIAKLSRISVDDEKAKKLAGDLNSIFDFFTPSMVANGLRLKAFSNYHKGVKKYFKNRKLKTFRYLF